MWAQHHWLFAATAAITTGRIVTAGEGGCSLSWQRKYEECGNSKCKYLKFHNDLLLNKLLRGIARQTSDVLLMGKEMV